MTLRVQDVGLLDHTDHDGLTSPKDIELREKSAHDKSEDEHSAVWGTLFRSKYNGAPGTLGALPDDVWAKAYKHAIVS